MRSYNNDKEMKPLSEKWFYFLEEDETHFMKPITQSGAYQTGFPFSGGLIMHQSWEHYK
jgi:hypothetical protein